MACISTFEGFSKQISEFSVEAEALKDEHVYAHM